MQPGRGSRFRCGDWRGVLTTALSVTRTLPSLEQQTHNPRLPPSPILMKVRNATPSVPQTMRYRPQSSTRDACVSPPAVMVMMCLYA